MKTTPPHSMTSLWGRGWLALSFSPASTNKFIKQGNGNTRSAVDNFCSRRYNRCRLLLAWYYWGTAWGPRTAREGMPLSSFALCNWDQCVFARFGWKWGGSGGRQTLMANGPSKKGKLRFTTSLLWLNLSLSLLRPVGRRELLDGDVSQIVDLETFECQCASYQSSCNLMEVT